MTERNHDRAGEPRPVRSRVAAPSRGVNPVLSLQRAVGNRATARVLGRKSGAEGTLEHSVRIGKLGPIEIKASNIADWIARKSNVDDLIATTVRGTHSDELKRLSDGKIRIENIEVQSITGENSWVIVTFKNALIRDYAPDASGETEQWRATRFDAVDIKRTSIGTQRP